MFIKRLLTMLLSLLFIVQILINIETDCSPTTTDSTATTPSTAITTTAATIYTTATNATNETTAAANITTTTSATISTTQTTSANTNLSKWSVECLVVVDKSAYMNWIGFQNKNITGRSDRSSLTTEEKARLAVAELKNFVKASFLAANLIWKGMEEHGVSLDLRIKELIIVKDEDVVTPNPDGKNVFSESAYWAFLHWLVRNGHEFDHAVLITGLNLVDGRRGGQVETSYHSNDSEGYAYINTMCSAESISLVEQHINGVTGVVLAHEVAHSLGAFHDGDGNNCPSSAGHIMNDNNIGLSPLHWTFSNCSAAFIKRKLHALEDSYDCLSPGSTRAEPIVWRSEDDNHDNSSNNSGSSMNVEEREGEMYPYSKYLGQLYSADQMCQMEVGSHSYLCRHLYGDRAGSKRYDICISLYCLNRTYCSGVATADGLPCGSGKRCLQGQCVPFSDVPDSINDDCYSGDIPHPAWRGQTCKQVVNSYTHLCHDQWYKDFCCQSCQDVSTGDSTCPYGDAHHRCAPFYCGTAWEGECCQTCGRR